MVKTFYFLLFKGLARDVIADENNYDHLRSWHPYRRDDLRNTVSHNNGKLGNSKNFSFTLRELHCQ